MARKKGSGKKKNSGEKKKNPIDFSSDDLSDEYDRDYRPPPQKAFNRKKDKGKQPTNRGASIKGKGMKRKYEEDEEAGYKSSKTARKYQEGKRLDEEEDYIPLDGPSTSTALSTTTNQEVKNLEEPKLFVFFCYPWMASLLDEPTRNKLFGRDCSLHAADWFHEEVKSLVQYLTPTPVEIKLREYLVHRVKIALQRRWNTARISVFGSFSTGMYLPNSDIDLVVQFDPEVGAVKQWAVADALKKAKICSHTEVISRAKVPVIKLRDLMTDIKVDIVINAPSGLESSRKIIAMLRSQPALKPLSLIIKHYLALRQLNEVFTGGLGGYAIICLVYSFLQRHPLVGSGAIDPMENLSVLLIQFFELYGSKFNLDKVGIDVRREGSYFERYNNQSHSYFAIRDPNDIDNDLGIKSHKTEKVVEAFQFAFTALTSKMFAFEEELSRNNYRQLKERTLSNPMDASILSRILCIPPDFLKHRDLSKEVYDQKRWKGQKEAESFDFDA
ncbi:hypothetical protein BDF20DRAFT_911957 [Mycotypha africana]|uniref:uncharacterized protein n=1 Tax=Mycotypha africana TaxID=64632 RepID=UPI002301CF17|nr:uncharacterized protein BDF20DRAFT_911957 [Mycotypha africana]KAI8981695.1 hypothetical protein BDF20DRAFT_911957 [Mycotypha africana]